MLLTLIMLFPVRPEKEKTKPVYLPITQKHGTSMERACLLANDH
jgi:hypothetical protein